MLLFDVMDTLVREPYWETVPAFFGTSLEGLQAQQQPGAWVDFELGRIDEATLFERFFRDRRSFDHAGLKARMVDAYRWLDGMRDLVAELAERGYELHALSNYPVWYRAIEERLGLSRFLAWSFVSCDTGVRKPDPEAFLGAARALGRSPEECLLVDDRAENCAAARALGMPAERFHGAAGLRRALAERGFAVRAG